ncbi:MAG: hypothetical protein IIU58_03060 [Clostridia bacterium]|nr:hypothetical protein [Clostridia bacterium]
MPEVRLIDANAFIADVLPECKYPDALKAAVERQPTIEAEPVRHGGWMKIEPTISLQSRWKCSRSKCGGIVHAITDYCPYCGARMDGGADNG